ncbi:MAG TPA: peptidase M23, partial [Mycobacterium sp.]|nr:peptidase M23 [Mycobacterium sp.]
MRPTMLAVIALTSCLVAAAPGVATAAHEPSHNAGIPGLVAEVAEANQRLSDLGASIQQRQEAVNKAIVEVQTARDAAAAAKRDVDISQQAVRDANIAIASAQQRFDDFAAGTYVNGPPGAYVSATSPDELIGTSAAGRTLALSFQQAVADLQRARTALSNKESAARAAQLKADQAAAEAQGAQDAAVTALTEAKRTFADQQAELDRLIEARSTAQSRLDAAQDRWDPAAASGAPPRTGAGQWDTTLPMVPSADVADPVAIVNSVLQVSSSSMQATAELGRKFLASLGINLGGGPATADPGITNGRIPRVYGR